MFLQPLTVHRNEALPQQAWLLHVSDNATLYCGAGVEVRQNAFFEGAWSGAFGNFDFVNCADVFGSGAVCTSEGWLLVPPSHTLEALSVLRLRSGDWVASNSIAFIERFTNIGFPYSDAKLFRHFVVIAHGIDYSPSCVLCSNGEFCILHHHNVLLGPDGLTVQPKPLPPDFDDFIGYRNYVSATVHAVSGNAADPTRRMTYKLLTTISSGYDSPACAALARPAGCIDAITFKTAREGVSDDGSEVARQLGLDTTTFERPNIVGEARETTAEFYATGMQAVDLICEVLRGRLGGHVLITGFHGDKVWDLNGDPKAALKRGDISGSSYGEFRLSEGFIHLPVPFIGALRHASILRISKSAEMKAFSIGGSYDRPIPRRIAEEAGVRRESFGQEKKAIITAIWHDQSLLVDRI
jgi:hypothetical protein